MKKFFLLSVGLVMMAAAVNAQTASVASNSGSKKAHKEAKKEHKKEKKELKKLEGKEVSYQSKQAFDKDFGNISGAAWSRTKYFDEVTFTNNEGRKMTAYYDFYSDLVGTTSDKKFADLPAKAQTYIDKKYNGYSKEAVIFFHDNANNEMDMVLYNNPFADADNYFVELKKGKEKIILQSDMKGDVTFFKKI